MRPVSSTEMASLMFVRNDHRAQKLSAPGGKVGWIHTLADQPGASFDIVVKDALGRTKYEKKNCSSETARYGELVNFPTLIGEELQVTVENLKGADQINLFLN